MYFNPPTVWKNSFIWISRKHINFTAPTPRLCQCGKKANRNRIYFLTQKCTIIIFFDQFFFRAFVFERVTHSFCAILCAFKMYIVFNKDGFVYKWNNGFYIMSDGTYELCAEYLTCSAYIWHLIATVTEGQVIMLYTQHVIYFHVHISIVLRMTENYYLLLHNNQMISTVSPHETE